MPNTNYRAGARVEYARRKHWNKRGYLVLRSAGSHGAFDLVGIHRESPHFPVQLIQVKRVTDPKKAQSLLEKFRNNPPLTPSAHYHQVMEVQVKGSSEVFSVTV